MKLKYEYLEIEYFSKRIYGELYTRMWKWAIDFKHEISSTPTWSFQFCKMAAYRFQSSMF